MNFQIIFHMDGKGIIYDPREPIHLDSLLEWALARRVGCAAPINRDEQPTTLPLPLLKKTLGESWVYQASALFPDGPQYESTQFWRKRLRQESIEITQGSPSVKNGPYRSWNNPMTLILIPRMVAYASGNRKRTKNLLREVKYLGKKRAHGHGKILQMEFREVEHNWSLVKDGRAMRCLPDPDGARLQRCNPPYWNIVDRVSCVGVGDPWHG